MMARDHDIKPFLDDPSLLTETFREVIEALDSSGEDDVTQEKEAQLREIAKSIERLEKAGVPGATQRIHLASKRFDRVYQ